MCKCFFVSDIHGKVHRYEKLFNQIKINNPEIIFIGGDILPLNNSTKYKDRFFNDFLNDYLIKKFIQLKEDLKDLYPEVFLIFGNDDPKIYEKDILEAEKLGIWHYLNQRKYKYKDYCFYGYSYVPPTPFLLKDWEKFDVSGFIDVGCISPMEGQRSVEPEHDIKYSYIKDDIDLLIGGDDLKNAVFLFHSPPYQTNLDRAALDGKMIDHAPLDVNVGSIAIKRFIEIKQPLLTLHGHVHESSEITGFWNDKIKKTFMFSAAYNYDDLAIVEFYLNNLENAKRKLI